MKFTHTALYAFCLISPFTLSGMESDSEPKESFAVQQLRSEIDTELSQLAIDLAQLDRSTVKYFQHKRKDVEVYISSGIRYIDWEKVHQPKNDPLPASLKTKDIKNALIHLATEIAYEKEEDNGIHKQEVTKLFDPLFKSPALAKLKSLGKHIWENHKQEISKDYTIRAKPVIQHELTVQTTATIFYCFYRKNQTIENAWTDQVSIRIKTTTEKTKN